MTPYRDRAENALPRTKEESTVSSARAPDGVLAGSEYDEFLRTDHLVADLTTRSVRGGVITVSTEALKLVTRVLSTVVLARLLTPEDYGLVGMVTVLIAFLQTFKDAGLSSATVQSERLTHEQVSTLFWINAAVGLGLAAVVVALSPVVAAFYGDPRLQAICIALSANFLLGGLIVQHGALQRRQMRFKVIAAIEVGTMFFGIMVAIVLARSGFGYWSLIAMNLCSQVVSLIATWMLVPWRPGMPRRGTGVRTMLGFGAFIVGSDFLNAFVRNVPQVLMGRLAGASQLGLYNKAYQLLMLPMNQIYGPLGRVVIPALSRLQSDPDRIRRYYLDAYTLAVAITLPISAVAAVFAKEIVTVVLGNQWMATATIFRYLAIAGAFIAIMSPTGWFLIATGRTSRSFKLDFFEVPIVLAACAVGVRYGAEGLALGFAIARGVECVPIIYLIFRETEVSPRDIWKAVIGPYVGVACAVIVGLFVNVWLAAHFDILVRLCLGSAASLAAYAVVLLVVFGNWLRFRELAGMILRGVWMADDAAVKGNVSG